MRSSQAAQRERPPKETANASPGRTRSAPKQKLSDNRATPARRGATTWISRFVFGRRTAARFDIPAQTAFGKATPCFSGLLLVPPVHVAGDDLLWAVRVDSFLNPSEGFQR